jgi:fibro-slime domain-containing protein
LLLSACSGTTTPGSAARRGSGGSDGSGASAGTVGTGNTGAGGGGILISPPPDMTPDAGPEGGIIMTLPDGYASTDIGGYQLGEPLSGPDAGSAATTPTGATCGNILLGVVRDFVGGTGVGQNPDFQGPLYGNNVTTGLVAQLLGTDQKPVYASKCEEATVTSPMPPTCPFGPETTTKADYDQWYRYTQGVNLPFIVRLFFAPQANGLFTFQSSLFFPLDNAGFGNTPGVTGNDGKSHNFSFTTELHTQFKYSGGETFTFIGDDDVWVFINNQLAVDLGGLHVPETGSVNLDASATTLGLTKGNTYDLDLFHAERHDPGSNFRIDTNLSFVGCGVVVPDVPK